MGTRFPHNFIFLSFKINMMQKQYAVFELTAHTSAMCKKFRQTFPANIIFLSHLWNLNT